MNKRRWKNELRIENKLDDTWDNLKKYREKLPSIFKKKKVKDMQLSMLQMILQNQTTGIENISLKNKEEIEEIKLKAKDMELKYLQEMISLRDSVITQTKKQLSMNKMELIIEEDSMETSEQVEKRMKMSFPSINFPTQVGIGTSKNRIQSVNVRIENKGGDFSVSDTSIPTITSNKHISSSLKPLRPSIKKNNYVKSNLRYTNGNALSTFGNQNSNQSSSLPKLSIRGIEKPSLIRKPSMILGQHPKKPYLNIRAPRKTFERVPSPSGASITSERTTTSLAQGVRSDSDVQNTIKQPITYESAMKQMKNKREIKAKDRMRLDRFKKEKFIYSTSAKKLSLTEKYKPIANTSNYNSANNYLNKIEPPVSSNITRMEEKKEGSSIPFVSHTERMKNNMQRLNLLPVSDNQNNYKSKAPIKSILKRSGPVVNSISPITSTNLKANTITNALSGRSLGY